MILLPVDIGLLTGRKPTVISISIRLDLAIDILLVPLSSSSFRWSHLPATNSLRNALLLLVAPRAHFVIPVVRIRCIVLVIVD